MVVTDSNTEFEGETIEPNGLVVTQPVLLATAGYDHTIRFWDVISGNCINTLQHTESVKAFEMRI